MDDTISRQAAIDALRTCYDTEAITHTNGNEYIDYDQALDLINTLPSAQPERKRGRWEYVDYGGFGNWHCTACGKICICNGDFDFCPNCGADMREVDE